MGSGPVETWDEAKARAAEISHVLQVGAWETTSNSWVEAQMNEVLGDAYPGFHIGCVVGFGREPLEVYLVYDGYAGTFTECVKVPNSGLRRGA